MIDVVHIHLNEEWEPFALMVLESCIFLLAELQL